MSSCSAGTEPEEMYENRFYNYLTTGSITSPIFLDERGYVLPWSEVEKLGPAEVIVLGDGLYRVRPIKPVSLTELKKETPDQEIDSETANQLSLF